MHVVKGNNFTIFTGNTSRNDTHVALFLSWRPKILVSHSITLINKGQLSTIQFYGFCVHTARMKHSLCCFTCFRNIPEVASARMLGKIIWNVLPRPVNIYRFLGELSVCPMNSCTSLGFQLLPKCPVKSTYKLGFTLRPTTGQICCVEPLNRKRLLAMFSKTLRRLSSMPKTDDAGQFSCSYQPPQLNRNIHF